MPYFLDDAALDATLDEIINSATAMTLCEGAPASWAAATTLKGSGGVMLATVAINSGDWTKAAGDTDGRKATVAKKTGVNPGAAGTADHIAFVDATSRLIGYQPCNSATITLGVPVDYPETDTGKWTNRAAAAET